MTFREKVKNIWDYDKWYILAGIIGVVLLITFVKDIFFKEKFDLPVIYIGTGYMSEENADSFGNVLSEFSEDFNKDGKTNVKIYAIQFSPKDNINPQMDRDANNTLIAEIMTQRNCLFIINDDRYNAVFGEDSSSLCDLSEIDNDLPSGTVRIPISDTVLHDRLPFLSDDLYVILRVPYNQKNEEDYRHAKSVLTSLLNAK